MIELNTLSAEVLFSTTRIEVKQSNENIAVGTSFYFHFKIDEQKSIPVLVTNRHVVADAKSVEFYVHVATSDSAGKRIPSDTSMPVTLQDSSKSWVHHPSGIDLCAMPFEPLRRAAEQRGIDIFYKPYTEPLIPSVEVLRSLAAMEEITMVGYPIGLWDRVNNLSLLRRGVTSSHPAINYNGKPIGLLDIAALPGSSGSPILILNQGTYAAPTGIAIGSRLFLLGILSGYYRQLPEGETEAFEIPTGSGSDEKGIPAHLGEYIKSRELFELKNELVKLIP